MFRKLFLTVFCISTFNYCYCQNNPSVDPCSPDPGPQGPGYGNPSDDGFSWSIFGFRGPSDPNDIIGPAGYGSRRFVAKKDIINYTINFENDGRIANTPAKVVRVTYPIDTNQDITTFRLGDFGFNNLFFQIPANSLFYNNRVDVIDSLGLFVDVTAGIDVTTRQGFWIFTSIDPLTGLPPTDPLKGLLLISDTTGTDSSQTGKGFVNFSIKPRAPTHTGDTMHAQASIIFETNDPVITNVELHTIDAVSPVSQITASPIQNDSIQMTFTAVDDPVGSGVKNYDLYVAQDSSNYITYLTNVTDSVISFHGTPGSTYHFFSLATDNVGNREGIKQVPDVSVNFLHDLSFVIHAFIQGYYIGNGTLRAVIDQSHYPNLCDTLILQLARSAAPYDIMFSDTSLLQTDGSVEFKFKTNIAEDSFYLVLRHRNSMETWNALPLPIQYGINNYNFTTSSSQAFGNNEADLGDGYFAMFSGDLNQDGVIESEDYSMIENAVFYILLGYNVEDITGDGVVESEDYSIVENNVYYVIYAMRP